MKVSVLTATWNRASFLYGAVRSVQAQTYSDWEHLIIDDGSTDSTASVLAGIAGDTRIRSWKTENRGQSAALNQGLAEARSPLIAFLDSDDEFLPHHLELMVNALGDHDFLLGKFIVENCTKDPVPKVRDFYHPGQEIEVAKIDVITGVMFGRREVFEALGGFRSVPSTDTDLFQRMKAAGYRWKQLSAPSYRYYFGRDAQSMAARDRDSGR